MFAVTRFLILIAVPANLNVPIVISIVLSDEVAVQMIAVLAFPPKLLRSSLVRFELR